MLPTPARDTLFLFFFSLKLMIYAFIHVIGFIVMGSMCTPYLYERVYVDSMNKWSPRLL